MRKNVLWRKSAAIVMLLAERLEIAPEEALDIFYKTRVCDKLHDERYGLHLQSDSYIVTDIIPN